MATRVRPAATKATEPASVIVELDATREALGERASAALLGGPGANDPGLGLSRLAAAAVFDWTVVVVLVLLGERMAVALGAGEGSLGIARTLGLFVGAVAAVGAAFATHGRPRRPAVARAAGGVVAAGLLVLAFAGVVPAVTLALAFVGAGAGAGRVAQCSLLGDVVPIAGRGRALGWNRAVAAGGVAVLLLLVVAAPDNWRIAALVLAAAAVVPVVATRWARDPGYGTADAAHVRQLVNERAESDAEAGEAVGLSFGESMRRVLGNPVLRQAGIAHLTIGAYVVPSLVFGVRFLRERHLLASDDRSWMLATVPLLAAVACPFVGRLLDRDPSRRSEVSARLAWAPLVGGAVLLFGTFSSSIVLAWIGLAVGLASAVVLEVPLLLAALTAVPAVLRPHAAAVCTAGWFLGGIEGLSFSGGMAGRYGVRAAFVGLALVLLSLGGLLRRTAAGVRDQVDVVAGELVEDQQIRVFRAAGRHVPLLSCRHIDFSYGNLQVLFDVGFSIEEGDMVALLGTNGAGKSTLLRVISGLGRPSAGHVRLDGEDITFLDAARRVDRGILQIPGGKATFPKLTVLDNLRANGYLLGRDRRAFDARLDTVFEQFPRLGERRHQLAGTLSGGEAQMLGLAKALLLRPRLLLIDELSLGLAPKVVGELLERVRAINAEGTAVVLVEQSVNIALSLVQHAYFMEKGRVRFDGPAAELLGRDDLLRSVFLEGATKGLG